MMPLDATSLPSLAMWAFGELDEHRTSTGGALHDGTPVARDIRSPFTNLGGGAAWEAMRCRRRKPSGGFV